MRGSSRNVPASFSVQRTQTYSSSRINGATDGPREDGRRHEVLRADILAIGEPTWSAVPPGRDCVGGANSDSDE